MESLTPAIIAKALDGLSTRYQFLAQNIANSGSAGYQPVEVRFESALRAAAAEGRDAIDGVRPTLHSGAAQDGSGQRLDLQLAESSQTAMRYSALISMLGRQMAMARTAIAGQR